MNCCDYGCNQGKDCPARATPFTCCQKQDISPQSELATDIFNVVGFVLLVAVICAAAGLAWGLFDRFYPSTACMVKTLFSNTCK